MEKTVYTFEATGTRWQITLWSQESDHVVSQEEIQKFIADFEKTFSRFREDSLVTKIAGTTGRCTVGTQFVQLLRLYERFYNATEKMFTPLMGQALSDAGYDAQYSFDKKEHRPQSVPDFAEVVEIVDEKTIMMHEPVYFDFGGAGKGFAIDLLAQLLREKEYKKFLINAGGDLYYYNDTDEAISVALEHPHDDTKAIGQIEIHNQSLCASGAQKRQWAQGQHHIIDPTTGVSVQEVIATWIMASTAALADGCATSLFFVAPEKLRAVVDFDYVIMYADGSITYSETFTKKLFLE